jgi:hypothetical protein
MSAPIKFEPAIPDPRPPITKEVRVEMLKDLLKELQEDPSKFNSQKLPFLENQAINVEKMIAMYKNDEISFGQEVWLINGRVVKEEDVKHKKAEGPLWHEV